MYIFSSAFNQIFFAFLTAYNAWVDWKALFKFIYLQASSCLNCAKYMYPKLESNRWGEIKKNLNKVMPVVNSYILCLI